MDHKLANRSDRNTSTLLFSPKRLGILHQGGRGQVKTLVMEHFNGVLFHKCGPANKQHKNHHHHQWRYGRNSNKIQAIKHILYIVFWGLACIQTNIILNKTTIHPTLIHGWENWALSQKSADRIWENDIERYMILLTGMASGGLWVILNYNRYLEKLM